MLYSSGTTGRPEGRSAAAAGAAAGASRCRSYDFLDKLWRFRDGHDLSLAGAALPFRAAGRRRPARIRARRHGWSSWSISTRNSFCASSSAIKVTHTQLVPTMFSRMLKLPEAARRRYDLSSLEVAIHAAAPCPVPVKQAMIDWWGPIILEYYGATEGMGFTALRQRGMARPQGHGRQDRRSASCTFSTTRCARFRPARPASSGSRPASPFEYFNDPEKTAEAQFARRDDEHGRRHRLCRRGRLCLSDRPRGVHDHLRRRQHLSAGMREPADHPSRRSPTPPCSACPTRNSARRSRRSCS